MEKIANIGEVVRARRSVRTFEDTPLSAEHIEKLSAFMREAANPFGEAVEFRLLDAAEHGLSSPVVVGSSLYFAGKIARSPMADVAFGYSFESVVLYAQSLGIGTVWIGGTFNRDDFERAVEKGEGELMPCASPLGYPAKKMSIRESMMRKGVGADSRVPFETLFFSGSFDVPLDKKKAGALAEPLELVRLAPSAVNRQPWRVVVGDDMVHFYLKRAKGFTPNPAGDMQRVDLGIALCHFALGAETAGLTLGFEVNDPQIPAEKDIEYIASCRIM